MLVRRHGPGYNFAGDPATGVTLRWGQTPGTDPARAPWPELADIAISGRCAQGCPYCYRDSRPDGPLMSLEQYELLLERLTSPRWGGVFQVALGGGEPAQHPELVGMLALSRRKGVVPNLTTSGAGLDAGLARRLAELVGAVAVSAPSLEALDHRALRLLTWAGARVNLHYLLGPQSLAQATQIVRGRHDRELKGVNAVIFLSLKPMGRARGLECLADGPDLAGFLRAVREPSSALRIGFDACLVPPLLRHTGVNPACVDACEGGFFSLFVDEALVARPCSFSTDGRFHFSLETMDLDQIWNQGFEPYRAAFAAPPCAQGCRAAGQCRGPCPHHPEIVPCPVTAMGPGRERQAGMA